VARANADVLLVSISLRRSVALHHQHNDSIFIFRPLAREYFIVSNDRIVQKLCDKNGIDGLLFTFFSLSAPQA